MTKIQLGFLQEVQGRNNTRKNENVLDSKESQDVRFEQALPRKSVQQGLLYGQIEFLGMARNGHHLHEGHMGR